jgi:hypothetical protein
VSASLTPAQRKALARVAKAGEPDCQGMLPAPGEALALRIMRQGRWKDQGTAQTYIRPATVFRDNPTDGLGDEEPGK